MGAIKRYDLCTVDKILERDVYGWSEDDVLRMGDETPINISIQTPDKFEDYYVDNSDDLISELDKAIKLNVPKDYTYLMVMTSVLFDRITIKYPVTRLSSSSERYAVHVNNDESIIVGIVDFGDDHRVMLIVR